MCHTFEKQTNFIELFRSWLIFLLLLVLVDHYCMKGVNGFPTNANEFHDLDNDEPYSAHNLKNWIISNVDDVVESLKQCIQFPGMSIGVIKLDGKDEDKSLTLTRNYGVMDVETNRPVNDDTRFCIGSVTKGFTAALLIQLLKENGTYTLDTPVRNILEAEFQLITPELTEKTTIRDILSHRVGIAKHFGAFLMGYNFSMPEIIRRIKYLPIVKPFRSSRVYNNFMYVVAGYLIQKLNVSWWETQLLNKFLKPLEMSKTTFADKIADWNNNFALPHALKNGNLVPLRAKVTGNILRPVSPAGSICTNAGDMIKWLSMFLRNGRSHTGQSLMNSSAIDELFDIHNHFPNPLGLRQDNFVVDSAALGYGLGWVVGNYRGTKRLFHSGFANYYYSMVSILPEKNIAVFTALNGPHLIKCDNGMKALHFYIMDLLLGHKPWLDASSVCSYPRRWLQKDAADSSRSKTTPSLISSTKFFTDRSTSTPSNYDYSDETTTTMESTTSELEMISNTNLLDPTTYESSSSFNGYQTTTTTTTRTLSNDKMTTFKPSFTRKPSKQKKRRRPIGTTSSIFFPTTNLTCEENGTCSSSPQISENNLTTHFDFVTSPPTIPSTKIMSDLEESSLIPSSSSSSSEATLLTLNPYGTRLWSRKRPLRRRRPKRNAHLLAYLKKYEGAYNNPFFGTVVITVNQTVPALQFNYGYYGKALLQPNPNNNNNNIFRMRFFNSIWYQSESDDMKLFSKLGMFDVQFGSSNNEQTFDKLVVFLFDTEKPPIFKK